MNLPDCSVALIYILANGEENIESTPLFFLRFPHKGQPKEKEAPTQEKKPPSRTGHDVRLPVSEETCGTAKICGKRSMRGLARQHK